MNTRHFIDTQDFTRAELLQIIELAARLMAGLCILFIVQAIVLFVWVPSARRATRPSSLQWSTTPR